MNLISAAVLLLLAILGVVVRKTYYYLPVHELKRRAESGDRQAAQLYRAVAYGGSLRLLLWLYIGLTTAASLIILARILPFWVGLLVAGPVFWAAFSWLPSSPTTGPGRLLTGLVTPAVVWILNYTGQPLGRSAAAVSQRTSTRRHTGLFEREDLVKLIEDQQNQPDNRISRDELEVAKRALGFDDHRVGDIAISRHQVKTVLAGDTVGPVLIDEIHKSGQDSVLVREDADGPVIGSLAFNKLDLHSSGQIRDLMDSKVYYLHEEDSLAEALHAFFTTGHPVFVVVNNFEEFTGIITVESILRQLVGQTKGSDFDQYTSLKAVAARHDQKHEKEITDEESSEEQAGEKESPPGEAGTMSGQTRDNVHAPSNQPVEDEFESVEEIDEDETPVKTDEEVVK